MGPHLRICIIISNRTRPKVAAYICYNEIMQKIIAYLLLVVGLALMCFAFMGMYQTFINKKPVVQVVQIKPFSLSTQYGNVQVDGAMVGQVLNITLFVLFMLFLAALGARVAGVGNQLLKTERICETLQRLRREDVLAHEKEIRKL